MPAPSPSHKQTAPEDRVGSKEKTKTSLPGRENIDLTDNPWTLAPPGQDGKPDWAQAIPSRVPGCVLDDLEKAGRVENPFYAENFRECAWVGETAFCYRSFFPTPASFDPDTRATLLFEGIDTYAEVFLNGRSLGSVDNQFLRHRFRVERLLSREGQNELIVRIDPVKESFEKSAPGREEGVVSLFDDDRPWIRKAQMTFGWDNCPYLVAGGITLPVTLETRKGPEIDDLQWRVDEVDTEASSCRLTLSGKVNHAPGSSAIAIRGDCRDSSFSAKASVGPGGQWKAHAEVKDCRFWWPNGMGDPDLYEVTVSLQDEGKRTLDQETLRIGMREVRVVTEPVETVRVDYRIGPEPGTEPEENSSVMDGACIGPWRRTPLPEADTVETRPFHFEVNGRRIFAQGFDWQAPDVLVGRITDEQIISIVDGVADANSNMLRAWGGGAIERDAFYRRCDERGLLLWQDFFFACAIYPRDPAFLERIQPEVEDIIKRLRNHTCLIAWCGDNESDMIEYDRGTDYRENPINKRIIPEALERLDAQSRHYHCSSPSGGPYPRSDFAGDKRNWGPNFPHGNYAHIRQESARFVSESGMKSFPSREAIDQAIPQDRQWPVDNQTWRLHWGDLDNTVRGDYLLDDDCVAFFGEPQSLEERIAISQFAQAYGTRLLIEQCRRRSSECGGILLWKTADQWPGCDQGIYDYLGHQRPLYQTVRKAFEPLAVSLVQNDTEPAEFVEAWISHWDNRAVPGIFRVSLLDCDRTDEEETVWEEKITVPANRSRSFARISLAGRNLKTLIAKAEFTAPRDSTGENVSSWYSLRPAAAFRYHQQVLSRHTSPIASKSVVEPIRP